MAQQPNDFEKRFQLLDLLGECEQSMDLFTVEFERLFNDIRLLPMPRFEMAKRLKALGIQQAMFLWRLLAVEAKREADCPAPEMEGHSQ